MSGSRPTPRARSRCSARKRTFHVAGHHYALVRSGGSSPAPARVRGRTSTAGWCGPSRTRTIRQPLPHLPQGQGAAGGVRLLPRRRPQRAALQPAKDEDPEGREIDALRGLAKRMRDQPFDDWPDLLLMLGDQVYADETSPGTTASSAAARPGEPPGEDVLDFEEYTHLYLESWCDPADPLAAVHRLDGDDLRRPRRPRRLEHLLHLARPDAHRPLWDEHIIGALMSYWVYQHIGNLRPRAPRGRALPARPRGGRRGADPARLRLKADRAARRHALELLPRPGRHAPGGDRLARRPCARGGRRSMLDEARVAVARGAGHRGLRPSAARHLAALAADARAARRSRPGARRCPAAPGASAAARAGEKVRQAVDLEHWAAFRESFTRLGELQRRGRRRASAARRRRRS